MRRGRRATLSAATCLALAGTGLALAAAPTAAAPGDAPVVLRQAEHLDRGTVAVKTADGVLVSWRLLGTEPQATGFHVYRDGQRLTAQPVTESTNLLDAAGTPGAKYEVAAVIRGTERARSAPVAAWAGTSRDIRIDKPADGTTPTGATYTYRANDASLGDLDGDGQPEIVLKWDPSNSQDNSRAGYTGEVFVDAYELDGTKLWRISLGRNIRAGAHYTMLVVQDFDGDGRSEVVMKTADGTRDGKGVVIGDANADHRNSGGYVLSGPEFLTVFDGRTGAALDTTEYVPPRGSVASWGDGYGNRVDRFLGGVAHLDGERPSIIMSRGYYTRTVIATFDFRDGKLAQRWVFDSDQAGAQYRGQGNHNLSVADVDGDGRDEIAFGAMTIDDDGKPLFNTRLGHGDAMHLSDLDPTRPGLEQVNVHEDRNSAYGLEMHDARTGQILWGVKTGKDTGRGAAADIDPAHPGAEAWAVDGAWNSRTGWMFTAQGKLLGNTIPAANHVIWWDGDLGREILDHDFTELPNRTGVGRIDEWDPATSTTKNLLIATGTQSNNDTKGSPTLQADLLGDWREEVIWRTDDSTALRLYTTPFPTSHRFPTLLHDPVYRAGIAWQNISYNQPPHTRYFLGFGTKAAPVELLQTPRATAVDVKVTPDTWDLRGSGQAEIRAQLRPPAGVTPEQVTGIRLVVNGTPVEATALDTPGNAPWRAVFDGAAVRAALAGSTAAKAQVTAVLHTADGRTLTGADTVVVERG
ncbi:rhamnogalacturonan lyase [Kineococcus sp. NUM-3379]